MSRWINLLALLPNTSLTLLVIGIAFLRFYDETDVTFLGRLTDTRPLEQPTHRGSLLGGSG